VRDIVEQHLGEGSMLQEIVDGVEGTEGHRLLLVVDLIHVVATEYRMADRLRERERERERGGCGGGGLWERRVLRHRAVVCVPSAHTMNVPRSLGLPRKAKDNRLIAGLEGRRVCVNKC